jgi:hypothetical protein
MFVRRWISGKPCISDTADQCRNCLNLRVTSLGKRSTLGNKWSDPPSHGARLMPGNTPIGTRKMHTGARPAAAMSGTWTLPAC